MSRWPPSEHRAPGLANRWGRRARRPRPCAVPARPDTSETKPGLPGNAHPIRKPLSATAPTRARDMIG